MHLRPLTLIMILTMVCAFEKQRRTKLKNSFHKRVHEMKHESTYGEWLTPRENELLLRKESGSERSGVECCPSVLELVEPVGGVNQGGLYVHLYTQGENKQRFYEVSCLKDVEGRPCRFMDSMLHNQSRCVQKYSYTNAIISEPRQESTAHMIRHQHHRQMAESWTFDFIRIRSGCSCELKPNPRKKKRHKGRLKRKKS